MFHPTMDLFWGAMVFGAGFTIAQIVIQFVGDLLGRHRH